MRVCNKAEAIGRMNGWGMKGTPFVFAISYLQDEVYVEEVDKVDEGEVLFDFRGFTNVGTEIPKRPDRLSWMPHVQPYGRYKESFDIVRHHLLAGNSFLVNLTCCTPVDTNLTLLDLFSHSQALYRFYVRDRFIVFSPEIFIRIDEEGVISSYPMKGTIDATLSDARMRLLEDVKEQAEHATIVDLIRNDLSMVADGVHVARYRYVDTLHTHRGDILQTSSEIRGRLSGDYREHLGDILFTLLPAGSITGAPKPMTMQVIAQAEGYQRGFYTGVMGCFDGSRLDSAVMIRFVERQQSNGQSRLVYKSGGGITFLSNAHDEYKEMIRKIYVPVC